MLHLKTDCDLNGGVAEVLCSPWHKNIWQFFQYCSNLYELRMKCGIETIKIHFSSAFQNTASYNLSILGQYKLALKYWWYLR